MSQRARVGVALVAVLVVAVLGWLLWPSSAASVPSAEASAGPYLVRLTADPATTGDNTVTVAISDGAGHPATPDRVSVEPVMTQMGHAAPPATATLSAPGQYRANVVLAMTGQWELTVRIAAGDQTNSAVLPVTITG